jgi:hypothetical protein
MQIPYVKQEDTPGNHLCGAASLCMVYQSFGLACEQADVWTSVSRKAYLGSRRAQTYRLAGDALQRGLWALVLQARQPWPILEAAFTADARIILNHRMKEGSAQGHFSVLVGVDSEQATLHDPQTGPEQVLTKEKLLELWQPSRFRSEVTGHVLVAIGDGEQAVRCETCDHAIPSKWKCRICAKDVPLHPAEVLGCTESACARRLWDFLFCPFCDYRTAIIPDEEISGLS